MRQTICLVDGVGRPKLIEFDGDAPSELDFIPHGTASRVTFDLQEEVDLDGRSVYRQHAKYKAPIRYEYISQSDIPFNTPRQS